MSSLPGAVKRTPLGDLSGLAGLIGEARVVALGENNHHIAEFGALRADLVRVLVTELGFTVVAMESGFPEGALVDEWLRGGPGQLDALAEDGFTFRFGDAAETQRMLHWLRAHNAAGGQVHFAGLDIPGSGGSPLPALRRVRGYLADRAAHVACLADAAVDATRAYSAANNGIAPARYADLEPARRDAATTALARLLLRLDAVAPEPDPRAHRIARHLALGALRLDEHLRELVELAGPDPTGLVVSSRDVYQAETVRLLRELHGPDTRIVLLQHNLHLQRTPMQLLPGVRAQCAGSYLAAELGGDYRAIGVTALTGTTTTARLDETARHGIQVLAQPLEPPAPDSLEHAFGAGTEPELVDLRPARGAAGPAALRHAGTHVAVDVVDAFDAVICLPTMAPSAFVRAFR